MIELAAPYDGLELPPTLARLLEIFLDRLDAPSSPVDDTLTK